MRKKTKTTTNWGKNMNTLEVQGHSSVVVATAAAGAAASAKM